MHGSLVFDSLWVADQGCNLRVCLQGALFLPDTEFGVWRRCATACVMLSLAQNGATAEASQPEQAAEPRRAQRNRKQPAAGAKEEAAEADVAEAAQPRRRAQRKATAAQAGAFTTDWSFWPPSRAA